MSDIRRIENRVRNLEYYTTLSLLETNTANLFVPDNDGLNRFKSGFFVDNFTGFQPQEQYSEIKNSIDLKNKELRPKHYTTSVDLVFGPVVNADATADLNFTSIEGVNVRKSNDIVTLDYAEVEWLSQTFATRTENVTPFLVSFWQGSMELTPSSDTWVDQSRLEAKIINTEGNYAETFNAAVEAGDIDPQTGFGPILWDSWETNWTGVDVINTTRREPNLKVENGLVVLDDQVVEEDLLLVQEPPQQLENNFVKLLKLVLQVELELLWRLRSSLIKHLWVIVL